jgi:hypothetical protein
VASVARTWSLTGRVSCGESLGTPVVTLGLVSPIVAAGASRSRDHAVEAGGVGGEVCCAAGVALIALDRSNRDVSTQIDSHGCRPCCSMTLGAIIDSSRVMGEFRRRPCSSRVASVARTRSLTCGVGSREGLGATVVALGLVSPVMAAGASRS